MDESLHRDFAVYLYRYYVNNEHKLSKERLQDIIKSAVEVEVDFVTEALPVSLIGMDCDKMSQYIRYVANDLYLELTEGNENLYNDKNPFPFMEMIALENKTNFFEFRVSEYQASKNEGGIELTDDF